MFGLFRFSSWLYDESKFYAAARPSMMPLDIADIADTADGSMQSLRMPITMKNH